MPSFDEAAFEALYQRLERPLYNAAYRYVWHAEDAHDVVQDAFMKVWDARARLRPEGAAAYAWRAVLNTASNKRRWKKLRGFVGLDGLTTDSSPHDALTRKLEDQSVRKAVDALPDDLKRVLLLSEVAGMKHDEIGDVLGIPAGTVASRRHRAFEKLKGMEVLHAAAR